VDGVASDYVMKSPRLGVDSEFAVPSSCQALTAGYVIAIDVKKHLVHFIVYGMNNLGFSCHSDSMSMAC
jgi:hypothetical protein